jgi:hypothetical protein
MARSGSGFCIASSLLGGLVADDCRSHEFQAPVWHKASLIRYKVWGMTARILVDTARIAYGRDPEFTFVKTIGEEDLIQTLVDMGEMTEGTKSDGSSSGSSITQSTRGNL